MKLIASVIARNERGRYLTPFVEHLLTFCDEIRLVDDGSTDGTFDALRSIDRVWIAGNGHSEFYAHEGQARQRLLEWTLQGEPTHVLSIDADEFVEDGQKARALAEVENTDIVQLQMEEVWKVWEAGFASRQDGAWRTHGVPVLWKVPPSGELRIRQDALACGRNPVAVDQASLQRTARISIGPGLLHFGWANPDTRQARYDRYVEHDGGRFHADQHLQSIMWPDNRVRLATRHWPEGLEPYREAILKAATT